jgi:hypothetical protein
VVAERQVGSPTIGQFLERTHIGRVACWRQLRSRGHEGGEDVVAVPVEVLAGAVLAHGRAWVGVSDGDLDVAEADSSLLFIAADHHTHAPPGIRLPACRGGVEEASGAGERGLAAVHGPPCPDGCRGPPGRDPGQRRRVRSRSDAVGALDAADRGRMIGPGVGRSLRV